MEDAAARRRLHDIFADSDEVLENRIDRALEVGTKYLGLPIGFFTRIEKGTQEIVRATGDHPLIRPKETCPLDEAYCRRTVEIEDVLTVQDANVSSAISEVAVQRFDLGTYIGAKVVVDDDAYGTVCFADEDHRDETFTDAEAFFVELLARLVGQALERRDYERELAKREERLNEQEEIYRAVIETSFDFVFRIDTEGRFTYNSPTVADFLHYTAEELDGQPITVVHPDEETTERAHALLERVLRGEVVEARDFPLETKSGKVVYADIRVAPIYDGSVPLTERSPADIVGIQGMAHDTTERMRREGLISVMNRVLRHNLRNEMTVISGYATMIAEGDDEDTARKAEIIERTANRLLDLSESARRIEENRQFPAELDDIDLVPLLERVVMQLETRYPDASVAFDAPDTAVAETSSEVEIALWELLDNAAKHGGDPPFVDVSVEHEGEKVSVRIEDDGSGLPDIEQAVMDSGRETPLIHGRGLGLWLVYWVVTNLEGELDVTSSQQGTIVEVRLPKPS